MADGSVKIDIEVNNGEAREKLSEVESGANETADGLEKMGDAGKEAGKGMEAVNVAAGNFLTDTVKALLSGIGEAIDALLDLSDTTREYREDMAKLDTAFSVNGFAVETASAAYEDFYAILGESDRSVEAVNHLAELTNNEQELAKWSDICAGVTAKFGDSLPIEGLTEAANETAKVGKVTGPLADAINWAAMSTEEWGAVLGEGSAAQTAFNKAIEDGLPVEDAFNAALAEISTEQERSAAITDALNSIYSDAADEYNELTAQTQKARRATSEFEGAQADLGEAIEPVTTAITELKTKALEAVLPLVEGVSDAFQDFGKWMEENPQKVELLKGALIGVATALGVLAVALGINTVIGLVTKAFEGLNLAMLTSPVLWVAALLAGLVAAFIYLWNTSESFRNFWINLWESVKSACEPVFTAIKTLFSAVWDDIKQKWEEAQPFFTALWEVIKSVFSAETAALGSFFRIAWEVIKAVWDGVVAYFQILWAGITGVFSVVVAFFGGLFSSAWAAIQLVWNTVTGYFAAVWATIEGIFAVVKAVLSGDFQGAWDAIQGIVGTWGRYFEMVWENIQNVFSAVAEWFGEVFQAAKDAISNVWDGIKDYFQTVFDGIVNVFSSIKSEFTSVGSNIISGIWAGISAGWDWLVGKVKSLADSLLSAAKQVLGIASPSKKFRWIGEMSAEGVSVGFDDVDIEKGVTAKLQGLTAHAQAIVSAESARMSRGAGIADSGFGELARAVSTQTAGINSLAGEYRRGSGSSKPVVLMLDGRELGRAVVDLGSAEANRLGTRLAY